MSSKLKEQINKIRNGDQNAFRLLVEQHQQYAFSLAFRILCNEEDARDTVQESFIKIWKNIRSYNPKMKFTTWIYKIVTNTAIDRMRSRARIRQVKLEDVMDILDNVDEQDAQVQLDNKEMGRLIRVIADELPEKQRMVFVMRDIQGLNTTEVVNILELKETAVKSNLYHARKFIREKLNNIMAYERRAK